MLSHIFDGVKLSFKKLLWGLLLECPGGAGESQASPNYCTRPLLNSSIWTLIWFLLTDCVIVHQSGNATGVTAILRVLGGLLDEAFIPAGVVASCHSWVV